jgi:hypothetical protein
MSEYIYYTKAIRCPSVIPSVRTFWAGSACYWRLRPVVTLTAGFNVTAVLSGPGKQASSLMTASATRIRLAVSIVTIVTELQSLRLRIV